MIRKVLGTVIPVVAVLGLSAVVPAGAVKPSFSVSCNAYPGDTVVTVEGGTDTVHLDYFMADGTFAGSPGDLDARGRTVTQASFDGGDYVVVQTFDHQGNVIHDDQTHYVCS
jgi:hypothetical protein